MKTKITLFILALCFSLFCASFYNQAYGITITSFSPTTGTAGTPVSIYTSGNSSAGTLSVYFGGVAAIGISVGTGVIQVTTPSLIGCNVPIKIFINGTLVATSVNNFNSFTIDSPSSSYYICSGTRLNLPITATLSGSFTYFANSNTSVFGEQLSTVASSNINDSLINNSTVNQVVYYHITATGMGLVSCSTTKLVNIYVFRPTIATISTSGSTTFCQGGSVILNANTGTGLTYQWQQNSSNISGATAASYTAGSSGNFVLVVTDNNSCSKTSSATVVTVNTLPNVSLGTITSPLCLNNPPVALTGNPTGGNYFGTGVSGSDFDPSIAGSGTFNVSYNYTDGNSCSATASQSVVVSLCTGIAEPTSSLVSIYPNPANDIFNVVVDASLIKNTVIELYDGIGKLIISEKVAKENTSMKINSLAKGIYTVRIISSNNQIVSRIIKE